MNEKLTRIGLDEVPKRSLTDFARLRAMSEDDLERAIADDPDTWAVSDEELARSAAGAGRYDVYRTSDGRWRWRLLAADGSVIAESGSSAATKDACLRSIESLRGIVASAEVRAA